MKRVIAYGFFSDMGINTGENAIKNIKNFIKQTNNKEWNLQHIYLYTGKIKKDNEQIKEINRLIENKLVDIVILLKFKHLGNCRKDYFSFIDKALANNVDVISIGDRFTTLGESGKINYRILRSIFETEEKVKAKRKENRDKER